MKVCTACGQTIPQAERRRICSQCNGPIKKRHRWRFGTDGRPRHNECEHPEGMPSETAVLELRGEA